MKTRLVSLLLVLACALPGAALATSQAVIPANGTDALRITAIDWFGTKYPLIASVQIRNN